MNLSKVKALFFVFALLIFTGLITVGCKQNTKAAWVNTNSLPGQTFTKNSANSGRSTIVYLGSDSKTSSGGFGPRDVSFEFSNLK